MRGRVFTMRSTSGMNPMSSIRSASSITRIFTPPIMIRPRSNMSIRRPGVAIRTSGSLASAASCKENPSPPISSACLGPRPAP